MIEVVRVMKVTHSGCLTYKDVIISELSETDRKLVYYKSGAMRTLLDQAKLLFSSTRISRNYVRSTKGLICIINDAYLKMSDVDRKIMLPELKQTIDKLINK